MPSMENNTPNAAATGGISSELLINVIRTLTSTASDDQRQLERERIEQGYQQSEKNIDKLLREHRADVMECLSTFQSVSRSLTNSREQIRNVKNSLSLCKTFLQCRRDDLNKFWQENAQQKTICDILRQIQQIKEIDKTIDTKLADGEYKELMRMLKDADALLKGPFEKLEGISQLRFIVSENLQKVFNNIVQELLQCLCVEPFELQMLELAKNGKVRESKLGQALIERYPKKKIAQLEEQSIRKRLSELLQSLAHFDQINSAMDELFNRMPNTILRLANDTARMIQMNAHGGSGTAGGSSTTDSAHLAQFMYILIAQLNGCSRQHALLSAELQPLGHTPKTPILRRFWAIGQEGMEEVLAEHLQVWRNKKRGEEQEGGSGQRKLLFSFENASFVSSVNASSRKKQIQLVCPPDIYNVVAIFHKLSVFCREVENQLGEDCCQIATFLKTYVAEAFFEQIRIDLERKTEQALSGAELWTAMSEVPAHSVKVLSSCMRILELCEEINSYIINMEQYALRFASFWLLILEHFIKGISDKYFQITMLRQAQGDQLVEYTKLSAAWVVDEDISRLLKSLPSWTAVKSSLFSPSTDQLQTPFAASFVGIESEQEIRERTQRESEILIGNLGTQKQMKKMELITNMEHIKVLACLHETLQWFVGRMRELVAGLSPRAQELLKTRIQISTAVGALIEQMLCDAINDRIATLEKLSDSMLLILHLELRFHCFFHLLPITQNQSSLSMLSQEEMDRDVMEFGKDLTQLHSTLFAHLTGGKLKYLFDGLGYLCSAIFIHSCQYINKLTEIGRKRICRAIFTVQKYLSQLSGRPETEMQRAQMFFDLLNKELDQLFTSIVERGAIFSFMEYSILLALLIRSHPILNSQPGALESATNQLREILTQRAQQQKRS